MNKEWTQKTETVINKIATAQVLLDALREEVSADLPADITQNSEPKLEVIWMLDHLNNASKYLEQAYDTLCGINSSEQNSNPLLDTLFDSMGSDLLKAMISNFSNDKD
ncbi:MAG: hypothetical protein IJ411_06390 [Oscillospiraceae bacterium]|nr:hypothetical protein [Oscillospiraceae bacterium]